MLAGAERTIREQRPDLLLEVHPGFLAKPTRVRDIVAALAGYRERKVYRIAPQGSVVDKLATRYTPGGTVASVADQDAWFRRCEEGLVTDPFWIVSTSGERRR